MVWSKLWSWIQLKNKVTLRKKTEKLKGEKKTKSGKSHIYKWHSQVVCTCLMLYLSIYLQCRADSAAYYISYFYSLFTCRVWFYPESRLLNKKFSLKKDKDHQLVKGNMRLEENLETKRKIWYKEVPHPTHQRHPIPSIPSIYSYFHHFFSMTTPSQCETPYGLDFDHICVNIH